MRLVVADRKHRGSILRNGHAAPDSGFHSVHDASGFVRTPQEDLRAELPIGSGVTRHLSKFRFSDEGEIAQLAAKLEAHLERPWTVERLTYSYVTSLSPERRAAAIYLLAASRDEVALRVVGKALYDDEPVVKISAAFGVMLYWTGEFHGGSAEDHLDFAREWWSARKAELKDPA